MNHDVIAHLCQQQATNPQSVKSLSLYTQIPSDTLHNLFTADSMTITASQGPWWDGKTDTQPIVKPMADNAGTWG